MCVFVCVTVCWQGVVGVCCLQLAWAYIVAHFSAACADANHPDAHSYPPPRVIRHLMAPSSSNQPIQEFNLEVILDKVRSSQLAAESSQLACCYATAEPPS